jgi:hypothetical protein
MNLNYMRLYAQVGNNFWRLVIEEKALAMSTEFYF